MPRYRHRHKKPKKKPKQAINRPLQKVTRYQEVVQFLVDHFITAQQSDRLFQYKYIKENDQLNIEILTIK